MKKQMIAAFLIFALLLVGCAQSAVTPSDPTDDILLENPTTGPAEPSESTVPTDSSEPTDGTEPADETTAPTAPATEAPATEAPTEPVATEAPKATTPHTHSYTSTVVAPTCTSQGYTLHSCTCGSSYKDSYTAALGHDYQVASESKSTPWSAGWVCYLCSRCGATYDETLAALSDAEVEAFRYEVSKAAVKYINEYRVAEGSTELTWLPGLSEVAMYRSEQLITNFTHDWDDRFMAFTKFQYGYWTESIYINGVPGAYTCEANEAIGGYNKYQSADAIGKQIANNIHNSSGHWSYIGDAKYSYAGVGCCVEGYWVFFVTPLNYG